MLFCKHKTKHAFQIFPTLNAAAAAIIMSSVTTTGTQYDVVELNLGLALPGSKRGFSSETNNTTFDSTSSSHNSPPHKIQAVGWPPVRASRKNVKRRCKYVKVAVDGAPYLRKVDLETYESYDQLLTGLETMFCCLTVGNHLNERKLMDLGNGAEYVPTYEDRDGDWMLAGDVPWKMFVESCKRIRLMIKSEATGLEIRKTDSKRRMMKLDEKYI